MSIETAALLTVSLLARIGFFLYGVYQDKHFSVKYTDVDYFVFNDAAEYVFHGMSPFLRDTYRYTPLLSWMLVPNHYIEWVHFGKMLFVIFDLLTGIIILKLLNEINARKRLVLSSLWLLNPMVITISTRGNAESVVCFLIMLSLYCLHSDRLLMAGIIYGLSIHFKIYPIIYCLPISMYIFYQKKQWVKTLLIVGCSSLFTVLLSSYLMYKIYGFEYLEHAYIYHIQRTDHRHNFSLWNMLLYFDATSPTPSQLAKFAFLPQMLVTMVVSVLLCSNSSFNDFISILFLQTFSFVTYNKVCTSQYFIWYLIFLPFYLAKTKLSLRKGILMLSIWILTQALWLSQGYLLEFKGQNVFFPGIFGSSVLFFLGNIWILGQFISDIKHRSHALDDKKTK